MDHISPDNGGTLRKEGMISDISLQHDVVHTIDSVVGYTTIHRSHDNIHTDGLVDIMATNSVGELEHIKTETRLIDEIFASEMGECAFLMR